MTNSIARRPAVGVVGFIGWGNFGDELFMRVHRQFLSEDFDVSCLHDLTKKPYYSGSIDDAVASVDAIVIGGGDLIIPWSLSELYWRSEYLERPVFLVGIGVPRWGGYSADVIRKLREFVGHSNVKMISARDPESQDWITTHLRPRVPVTFAPDIVCALQLPPTEREGRTLGVVTRMRKNGQDNYFWLERLCERAARLDYRIDHLVLGTGEVGAHDAQAAAELRVPGRTMVRSEDLDELCAAIGRCSALASMKFHGSVVAAMYGTPSIVLSATDKNRNFMRMIDRPELLSSLDDPHLPDRFSPFMASIPPQTREWLRSRSTEAMLELLNAIRREIAPSAGRTTIAARSEVTHD